MEVQPQNAYETLFAVVVLVVALVIFGSFISSITSAMTALRAVNARRADQFWLLRKYLRQHSISQDLTMHVTRYLTIAVNRQKALIQDQQVEILGLLSTPLRMRLKHELYSHVLIVHPLFDFFSLNCVSVLNVLCCSAVQEDHLSKGDVVFHLGETAQRMIFITEGKAVYVREEQNPTIIMRNQWCSEAVLWVPWVHRGEMLALTDGSVLGLVSEAFREVVLGHPAHAVLPRRYAAAFAKRLTEEAANGGSPSDVSPEEGRIEKAHTAHELLKNLAINLEGERSTAPENTHSASSPATGHPSSENRAAGAAPGVLLPSNTLTIIEPEENEEDIKPVAADQDISSADLRKAAAAACMGRSSL